MSELTLHHLERAAQEQLRKEGVSRQELSIALRDLADRIEMEKVEP